MNCGMPTRNFEGYFEVNVEADLRATRKCRVHKSARFTAKQEMSVDTDADKRRCRFPPLVFFFPTPTPSVLNSHSIVS